jgi:hypothetical protein
MTSIGKVTVAAVVLMIIAYGMYATVVLYQTNRDHYPVLLAGSMQGANFEQRADAIYCDRKYSNKGVRLPYIDNQLMFVSGRDAVSDSSVEVVPVVLHKLPAINHQVQFTLDFWIRLENATLDNSSSTHVLFAQSTDQFVVKYNIATNALIVSLRQYVDSTDSRNNGEPILETFADVLLLQRWQHVSAVLDNRHLDIYIDGVLHDSRLLSNVPYLQTNRWQVFPGSQPFLGTVACARYFDYALNRHEVVRLDNWLRPASSSKSPPKWSYYTWWTWRRGGSLSALLTAAPANDKTIDIDREYRTITEKTFGS